MARTPTGTLYSVATAFGTAKNTTVVSNATEAVVTSAAHGYANGDILEVTSGWSRLNLRAFRIKSVSTNDFVLEGCDTSNTSIFTPGGGIGSVRKATTFVGLTGVLAMNSSGGEPKKITYKYIESEVEYNLNDGFTAVDRTFEIDADMIGTPGYSALQTLTQVQTNTIFKSLAKSGAVNYLPCTVSLNDEEIISDGSIVKVNGALSGNNKSTRYAS